jgi:predicted HicB family RNase H-like nuclease
MANMSEDKQQLNLRIPEELHREVKAKAAQSGKSLTQVIVELLTFWVKRDPPEDDKNG